MCKGNTHICKYKYRYEWKYWFEFMPNINSKFVCIERFWRQRLIDLSCKRVWKWSWMKWKSECSNNDDIAHLQQAFFLIYRSVSGGGGDVKKPKYINYIHSKQGAWEDRISMVGWWTILKRQSILIKSRATEPFSRGGQILRAGYKIMS